MSTLQARQPLRKCNRPLVGVPASPIWKREVSRARGRRSKKTRASFSMHHQLYHKRIRVKPKEDPGLGCSPAPVQLSKNRFIRIVEVVLSKSNGDPTKSNGEGSARQTSLSRLGSSECRLTWSMMSRPGGAAFRGHQAPQHRVVPVLVGVELRNFRRIFGDDVVSGSLRSGSRRATAPIPRQPTAQAGERRAVAADQAIEPSLHSGGRLQRLGTGAKKNPGPRSQHTSANRTSG